MGLFLVNYYQNESHVSTAASIIHDYKFNYDSVNLLVGTNKEKTLTYEELAKDGEICTHNFIHITGNPLES